MLGIASASSGVARIVGDSRTCLALERSCGGGRRRRVEDDHVAGIDPVRIPDLVAIHAPDVGPAPRVVQELARNAPQRVALLHDVAVGDPGREREVGGAARAGAQNEQRGEGHEQALRYAKLLTHKASSGRAPAAVANVLNRRKIRA